MPFRIAVSDDQNIRTTIAALQSDVDSEQRWLVSANNDIMPKGAQLPAAIELQTAWTNHMDRLEAWYCSYCADLSGLQSALAAAHTLHERVEDTSASLANKAMS